PGCTVTSAGLNRKSSVAPIVTDCTAVDAVFGDDDALEQPAKRARTAGANATRCQPARGRGQRPLSVTFAPDGVIGYRSAQVLLGGDRLGEDSGRTGHVVLRHRDPGSGGRALGQYCLD